MKEAALTPLLLSGLTVGRVLDDAGTTHRPATVAWRVGSSAHRWPPIVELDYLTADASVAAQIFLFFPTLYGASQLPRAGAIVMTAASVVGEIIVVVTLLPF